MAFNLAKCDFCGDCLDQCKYTDYDKKSGGEQIRRLVRGETAEVLTECVTCAACNAACDKGANPFDLILQCQERTGVYETTPSYYQLVETIDRSPGEIVRGDPGRPVINLCVVDVIPRLFEGEMFEGCTFLKGGAYESMLAWIHVGKETPLRKTLPKKVDALAETGFREIIMFHDDCYAAYTTKALEYGIHVPFKVTHYVEYLRDYLRAHADRVRPLNLKIAYQQPCSSRYTPWMDRHVDELFRIMGVQRVDRTYDRKNALCCSSPVSPHLGNTTGEAYKAKNIRDALDHGARAMVFLCPFCALQMREEADRAGMQPIFLTSLARMALGEALANQAAGMDDDREPIAAAVKIVKGLL
jgi:Fe-S oxidoreductase